MFSTWKPTGSWIALASSSACWLLVLMGCFQSTLGADANTCLAYYGQNDPQSYCVGTAPSCSVGAGDCGSHQAVQTDDCFGKESSCWTGTKYQCRPCKRRCSGCAAGNRLFDSNCGGDNPCVACDQGQYQPSNNYFETTCSTCASCSPGFYRHSCGGSSQGSCIACPEGTYKDGDGSQSCSPCAGCNPGFYRVGCGDISPGYCEACPIGSYKTSSGAALDGCTQCSACSEGYELEGCGDSSAGTCVACAEGKFKTESSQDLCSECQPCDAGLSRVECGFSSAGVCSSCPAGQFKPGAGSGPCTTCPGCPPGQFRSECGEASQGNCVSCPAGTFKFSDSNAACSVCAACNPGEELFGCGGAGPGQCRACPDGKFKQTTSADACQTCSCEAGQYASDCSPIVGPTCVACPSGTFKADAGGEGCSDCEECSAGFYRLGCGGSSAGTCEPCSCPAGTFSSQCGPGEDRGSCDACPTNSFKTQGGSGPCETCLVDFCPDDQFLINCGGSSAGECHGCAPGQYQGADSQCVQCQDCPAGSFRSECAGDSAGTCADCAAGKFKFSAGLDPCVTCGECGASEYTTEPCTATSDRACADCATAPACDDGKFRAGCGSGIVGACEACQDCEAGKYREGCTGLDPGRCVECRAGTFKAGVGTQVCEDCKTCSEAQIEVEECTAMSDRKCQVLDSAETRVVTFTSTLAMTLAQFTPAVQEDYKDAVVKTIGVAGATVEIGEPTEVQTPERRAGTSLQVPTTVTAVLDDSVGTRLEQSLGDNLEDKGIELEAVSALFVPGDEDDDEGVSDADATIIAAVIGGVCGVLASAIGVAYKCRKPKSGAAEEGEASDSMDPTKPFSTALNHQPFHPAEPAVILPSASASNVGHPEPVQVSATPFRPPVPSQASASQAMSTPYPFPYQSAQAGGQLGFSGFPVHY